MDYKSFQKAISDRLGSQFGVSVLISFVYWNWELLFQLADLNLSMDEKIACVKDWDFWFWLLVIPTALFIVIVFQAGTSSQNTLGDIPMM